FVDAEQIPFDQLSELSLDNIHDNFIQYVIGAILLSVVTGLIGFLASWAAFSILRKNPESNPV
ncbi:MAG: hypothetical protein ACPG5W_09980, partial [Flavobacteriales bacterium]